MGKIVPVILSGGNGTRLWPLSQPAMPKQFLPVLDGRSLFSLTLSRIDNREIFTAPVIVCSSAHYRHVTEILNSLDIIDAVIVCEPVGRNTAPAFCAGLMAAAEIDPQALCLLLPTDHHIPDESLFHDIVQGAAPLAMEGHITTFGIVPHAPHTGYGYIERGAATKNGFRIKSFKEKPDSAMARQYVESGHYYWNSGIFLVRIENAVEAFKKFQPDMLGHIEAAWAKKDNNVLEPDSFSKASDISFDYAIMEKISDACIVPAVFSWDDLGSWNSLWGASPKDENDNVIHGNVIAVDTTNSYLRSDGQRLCVTGMNGMIVLAAGDSVLVAPRDAPEKITALLNKMAG